MKKNPKNSVKFVGLRLLIIIVCGFLIGTSYFYQKNKYLDLSASQDTSFTVKLNQYLKLSLDGEVNPDYDHSLFTVEESDNKMIVHAIGTGTGKIEFAPQQPACSAGGLCSNARLALPPYTITVVN